MAATNVASIAPLVPAYQPHATSRRASRRGVYVTGVGYDDASTGGLNSVIQTDVQTSWDANETSLFTRVTFDVDLDGIDGGVYDALTLRIKYDDGFVAYLNGTEIMRSENVPAGTPRFDTLATPGRPLADVLQFADFDITGFRNLLHDDDVAPNVLAIHVMNATRASRDLLVSPVLIGEVFAAEPVPAPIYYTLDGSDPRLAGGNINNLGVTTSLYGTPIVITETTTVRARVLLDGQWSAVDAVTFVVSPADATSLAITEVHYNPAAATAAGLLMVPGADNDDFEFIEVTNTTNCLRGSNGVGICDDSSAGFVGQRHFFVSS